MHLLIKYELEKIWGKRNFLFSVLALLCCNLFLLWYTNQPDDITPPLSAYKIFQSEINHMTEQEKGNYMEALKKTLDNMTVVDEVLTARQLSGEMGEYFVKQTLENNPGVFVEYHVSFQRGDYLRFTDSFYQEKTFVNQLYREWQKVSGYGEYLNSIRENRDILSGIGIFAGQNKKSFSSRNIEKSAMDYALLTDTNICWMPEKPFVSAIENKWTDLLIILSAFLFAGSLIFQEKEKKLFYVTRSTRRGICPCILGKLGALFLHCIFITVLLYGENLVFFGMTAGLGSVKGFLGASLQSLSGYMESSLPITIGQYMFLSLFTKALALFSAASILTALCILGDHIFLPYAICGMGLGISWMLYLLLPAGTKLAPLKYLNPAGILRTENLYGTYLNFDLLGYPISRTLLSWLLLALLMGTGISLSLLFFRRGRNLSLREKKKAAMPFRPHVRVFWHECYKIMITGHALVILVLFGLFLGYGELTREYTISPKEQYYQDMMLCLEGSLTPEKEEIILTEKARFQEAFEQISLIEAAVSDGTLSSSAGEDLKSRWYTVTAFYPSFERVLQQYYHIQEHGGCFLYDTGYVYLLGKQNNSFPVQLLLLSLCSIFAFGNCLPMEYQSGAWRLLNSSRQGKSKVFVRKAGICILAAALSSLIPPVCRAVSLSSLFPMHGLGFMVDIIPAWDDFPLQIPMAAFLFLFILSQAASLVIVTLGILLISIWRKDCLQTIFFSLLVFAMPLILKLLGLEFAGWFSVYPLYAWTAMG